MIPKRPANVPSSTSSPPAVPQSAAAAGNHAERLDTRVIDLIMPIGKGQRALIVAAEGR